MKRINAEEMTQLAESSSLNINTQHKALDRLAKTAHKILKKVCIIFK